MRESAITRRRFLQTATAGSTAVVLIGPGLASAGRAAGLSIEVPFHGAILNRRHGEEVKGGLRIEVSGTAPLRDRVIVNGAPARRAGAKFTSEITLREKETHIVALRG